MPCRRIISFTKTAMAWKNGGPWLVGGWALPLPGGEVAMICLDMALDLKMLGTPKPNG